MASFFHRIRLPLMAASLLALLAAMWAGLLRLGWALPSLTPTLAGQHGPLMVAGFLGTLISLERSVALGRPWTYAPPILAGLGVLSLLGGLPLSVSLSLAVLSSLGLIAVFVLIVRRQPALFNFTMLVGAVAWSIGSILALAGHMDLALCRLAEGDDPRVQAVDQPTQRYQVEPHGGALRGALPAQVQTVFHGFLHSLCQDCISVTGSVEGARHGCHCIASEGRLSTKGQEFQM